MDTSWYEEEDICYWCRLVDVFEHHADSGQWIFRGHGNAKWSLTTPLERQYLQAMLDETQFEGKENNETKKAAYEQARRETLQKFVPQPKDRGEAIISRIEGGLLRDFQRRAHHYSEEAIPESTDTLEWLALMRHYGAPTRLLDWTYSFFVAAFFALADSTGDSAIWAVDTGAMPKRCEAIIAANRDAMTALQVDPNVTQPETFAALFLRPQPPLTMVGAVTPRRLNRRLTIQQGTFLCPANITVPFEDNLKALVDQPGPQFKPIKYVLRFSFQERQQVLRHLLRMNISSATLFPDLQGLARSLQTRLVDHERLVPDQSWHVVRITEPSRVRALANSLRPLLVRLLRVAVDGGRAGH